MRVVMFGFQTWGRKTLRALIDLDHEVVLAVTHPASEHSFYRGERIEVLEARVSEARYGGTLGRVIVQRGGGAVVSGPQPFRGGNRALVVTSVRTRDGVEHRGDEFFLRGGYLNDRI